MPSFSIAKYMEVDGTKEAKVYWDSTKHNHDWNTGASRAVATLLANAEGGEWTQSDYRSGQSKKPSGKIIYYYDGKKLK